MTYLFCLHLLKRKLAWFGLRTLALETKLSEFDLKLKFKSSVSMKDKVTHCNWLNMNCDFIVLVLSGMQFILASPAAKSRPACYVFCFCFLLSIFNNFCQINYLEIYPMNLRQIYRVGRIMAVDDQPEISFLIDQGTLPWQPNFVF